MVNIKLKVKKPTKKHTLNDKKRRSRNKENMKWIVKKYRIGELDINKQSHYIMARIAVSKGLLPKEVLSNEE